jgi:hypothetical protein
VSWGLDYIERFDSGGYLDLSAGVSNRVGLSARAEGGWRLHPSTSLFGFGEWSLAAGGQVGVGLRGRF